MSPCACKAGGTVLVAAPAWSEVRPVACAQAEVLFPADAPDDGGAEALRKSSAVWAGSGGSSWDASGGD